MTTSEAFLSPAEQANATLDPLREALGDPERFAELLARYGWVIDPAALDLSRVTNLLGLGDDLDAVQRLLDEAIDDLAGADPDRIARLFERIRALLDAINRLTSITADPSLPAPLNRADFWAQFPRDLGSDLIVSFFERFYPAIFAPLHLMGVLDIAAVPFSGTPDRVGYERRTVTPRRLTGLFHIEQLLGEVYGWGAAFDYEKLLGRLERALAALGFKPYRQAPPDDVLTTYYPPAHPLRSAMRELVWPIVGGGDDAEGAFGFALGILPIPAAGSLAGPPVGLMLSPIRTGRLPERLGELRLVLRGPLATDRGIFAELRPGSATAQRVGGGIPLDAELALLFEPASPAVLFGSLDADHVRLAGYGLRLTLGGTQGAMSYAIQAFLGGLAAIVDTGVPFIGASGLDLLLSCARCAVGFGSETTIELSTLTLSAALLPDLAFGADLKLRFKGGQLQPGSTISLNTPDLGRLPGALGDQLAPALLGGAPAELAPLADPSDVTAFHLDGDCLVLGWRDPDVSRIMRRLSADLFDAGPPAEADLRMRVVFGRPVREVRFDWVLPPGSRELSLPGVRASLPGGTTLSLVLAANDRGRLDRAGLVATVARGSALSLGSTFAWGRGGDRELQNDDARESNRPPLIQLALAAVPGQGSVSLLLLNLPLAPGVPLRFLRALAPLAPLAGAGDGACAPVDLSGGGRSLADDWTARLTLNTEGFSFPFLRSGPLGQFIQLEVASPATRELDLRSGTVTIPVGIKVQTGGISAGGTFEVGFDLDSFGVVVEHPRGIELLIADADGVIPLATDFLGFQWQLRARRKVPNPDRYHILTLVTEGYDYRIVQAPDSVLEMRFDGISEEPLVFRVTDFAIGASGISLTASVSEEPVRLRALNTKFSFGGSGFRMVDSRVEEFSLSATGSLPPALVGDSQVGITLRFRQQGDRVVLYDGSASLRGTRVLDSRSTRFRFTITEIDLGFVQEGRFHLYFILSGTAQFVLQDGDDRDGPLALLPDISISFVKAPLTGDASVIARHIKLLVTLPKKVSFNFFGCFGMEIRALGFLPQAPMFDGDAAMVIGGQISFAQGEGDARNPKPDYHTLYIGLPAPGEVFPRIWLRELPASLSIGRAFTIEAVVHFYNDEERKGFAGEGLLVLAGLPSIEAAFSFVRVRSTPQSAWLRAWFIALNVGRLSIGVQILPIFIREIGFGFGYRYTLASIKAADRAGDIRALVKGLDELSRTQGNLASLASWEVDIDPPQGDPRWTIVLRAMLAQSTASALVTYNEKAEEVLACMYLFDAVIAFRSDLTFYMAARGWINTNYNDYFRNVDGVRSRPLVTGYILLSAPQKRFLARVVSNPNGSFGTRPELPDFVEAALKSCSFSASLLIEPGLIHYELGWPDLLRWGITLGPFTAQYRGGFLFRVVFRKNERELVIGASYSVLAIVDFRAGIDLGFIGVALRVYIRLAYGAKFLGVVSLSRPLDRSMFYGRANWELTCELSVEVWVDLWLVSFRETLSLSVSISASVELAINGVALDGLGLRGRAFLGMEACGHRLGISVDLGFGEKNVEEALRRTQQYETLGLGTEEPPLDVPAPGTQAAAMPGAALLSTMTAAPVARGLTVLAGEARAVLETPHYVLLAVRPAGDAAFGYFVMFPKGEPDEQPDGTLRAQRGFLPPPPTGAVDHDFALEIPGLDGIELDQYIGGAETWARRSGGGPPASDPGGWFGVDGDRLIWRVNWDAPVMRSRAKKTDDGRGADQTAESVPLRQFVRAAFLGELGSERDPEPLDEREEPVDDERVHNPSESDFEAAVRGAYEQFRGAPFFRHDERFVYDKLLREAFDQNTTIYTASGTGARSDEATKRQAAQQMRGMIVQQIITDLRAFAQTPERFEQDRLRQTFAFQLGLVFRYKLPPGAAEPPWLAGGSGPRPTIRQRPSAADSAPAAGGDTGEVQVFNTPRTSFAAYPPAFRRLRSYSSATTIAITWDLGWDHLAPGECSPRQADPNHHLAYYLVRRRALDSNQPDRVLTVKPAPVLHRKQETSEPTKLKILRPRFQVVDTFDDETDDDRAALPAEGRRYLYTVTPFDVAGAAGRPLSTVVARFPDEPPLPPTDAEAVVAYRLSAADLAPAAAPPPERARLLEPLALTLTWTTPPPRRAGPTIQAATYRIVFRSSATLPAGSYGLDGSSRAADPRQVPQSAARPLPTDVIVRLDDLPLGDVARDGANGWRVTLTPERLRAAGVLPPATAAGVAARSWEIFIQAIGPNEVPSALAPAEIALRFAPEGAGERFEERRPGALEWVAAPIAFPLLPPEDQRALDGSAHVPMPRLTPPAPPQEGGQAADDDLLGHVAYRAHPAAIRAVGFRWNQVAAEAEGYPLDLHAGYHLVELDVDAHTDATFHDRELLAAALRPVQEVQVTPGDTLLLIPGDTLAPARWEAWYAGAVQRRFGAGAPPEDPDADPRPWYSWRESHLAWPNWPGVTNAGAPIFFRRVRAATEPQRGQQHHPLLAQLLRFLERLDDPASRDEDLRKQLAATNRDEIPPLYIVELQQSPPTLAESLDAFREATAPAADPYGWAILRHFGLSATFALRDYRTRAPVPAADTLKVLQRLLPLLDDYSALKPHLHIELLFQPGSAVRLSEAVSAEALGDSLLAIVQVSLRPVIVQRLAYRTLAIRGKKDTRLDVTIELDPGERCTVLNLADPAAGEVDFPDPGGAPYQLRVTIPASGEVELVVRFSGTLKIGVALLLDGVPTHAAALGVYDSAFTYQAEPSPRLLVRRPLRVYAETLSEDERRSLPTRLTAEIGNKDAVEALIALSVGDPVDIAPTDARGRPAQFTAPKQLAELFANQTREAGGEWRKLDNYLRSIPSVGSADYRLPRGAEALAEKLPELLIWLQRFFDHGPEMVVASPAPSPLIARAGAGQYVATAYPRAATPAFAAPDESGRVGYTHLIPDRWGHALRYYIQPYGRYDRLLQSLRSSPLFAAADEDAAPFGDVRPNPQDAALDVVIDRTERVRPPMILRSARLDAVTRPDQPAQPDRTWEVIIAQHPEQTLVERNQTLARRLAFRGIAVTLLRRFGYAWWVARLAEDDLADRGPQLRPGAIELVEHVYPAPPGELPAAPDHLLLPPPGPDGDEAHESRLRTIDLPLRLTEMQQGVTALQWEGLPHFYATRLLAVAQAAGEVSGIAEVVQRDFEYSAPVPAATMAGAANPRWTTALVYTPPARTEEPLPPDVPAIRADDDQPAEAAAAGVTMRGRRLRVTLSRLWDSLPEVAQARWPADQPNPDPADPRRLSALPDPEVVYQVVELFSGNVEVQFELFYNRVDPGRPSTAPAGDTPPPNRYARRQLGRRLLTEAPMLIAPDEPNGDYLLEAIFYQTTELPLSDSPPVGRLPAEVRQRVQQRGRSLLITGVLDTTTKQQLREVITAPDDLRALERLYESWYSRAAVSAALDASPFPGDLLAFEEPNGCILALATSAAPDQRAAVRSLSGDEEFRAALARLATDAARPDAGADVFANAPLGIDQTPGDLPSGVTLTGDESRTLTITDQPPTGVSPEPEPTPSLTVRREGGRYSELVWRGLPYDSRIATLGAALERWAQIAAFRAGGQRLFAALDATEIVVPLAEAARPRQRDLDASPTTAGRLAIVPGDAINPGERLRWTGPAPDGALKESLRAFPADRAFTQALSELLAQLDADTSVPLPAPPPEPDGTLPADPLLLIPPALADRLVPRDDGAARELVWRGPVADEEQVAVLIALRDDTTLVDAAGLALRAAVGSLISQLEARRIVALPPGPLRPYAVEEGDALFGSLVIEPQRLVWRGRVRRPAQLDELRALAYPNYDAAFVSGIQQLVADLLAREVSVTIDIPARPRASELGALADVLLIGRSVMRYHGLMTEEEGNLLWSLAATGADRRAIQRLYAATLARGMAGRSFALRARRGSAAPSELRPIDVALLTGGTQ